jgi:hypothetical protein
MSRQGMIRTLLNIIRSPFSCYAAEALLILDLTFKFLHETSYKKLSGKEMGLPGLRRNNTAVGYKLWLCRQANFYNLLRIINN